MPIHAWLGLAAALLLLAACAPVPQSAVAPPGNQLQGPNPTSLAPAGAAPTGASLEVAPAANATVEVAPTAGGTPGQNVAGGWQAYTNTEAGFSIRYPPDWSLTQIPPPTSQPMYGVALEGPEGRVELQWGTGFGGACSAYSAIHATQGQLPACHTVGADGTRHWEQIYKKLPTTGFGARAFTKDAKPASADVVLAVLATLIFGAPAGQATVVATSPPAQGTEIVVDNGDASFWPKGNWYFLKTPQMYGQDCYNALPGLDAAGEVRPDLSAGAYEVFAWWCGDPDHNQSRHGVIEVHRSAGDAAPQAVGVNYQEDAGQWQSLGTYNLQPGAFLRVKSVLDGSVVADAFLFVYRSPAGAEAVPTALPTGPIVTHNPPSPLQQVTSGDLAARLALVDPFYVSAPMTATQQTFDDCQAFPRDGCSGTRAGWQAIVGYEAITLTYRVSSDYKLVAIEGAGNWLDPWMISGDHPQRVFLRGYGGGSSFGVYYYPDNTWHLLRPGGVSGPGSDVTLTQDQGATLRELAPKYGTLDLRPTGGGPLVFYGLGPAVAPSDADRDTLFALSAALAATPP